MADTNYEAPPQVDDNVDQLSAEGCDIALSPAWEGATTDDNGVELICIDGDDDPLVVNTCIRCLLHTPKYHFCRLKKSDLYSMK